MVDVPKPKEGCGIVADKVRIERIIKLDDTTYDLFAGPCKCGAQVYRIIRTCGSSLSVYEISTGEYERLDEYIAKLHTTFAVDVWTKLSQLRETIQKHNSRGQFDAHGMSPFRVRLIDR